jgi:flavorubredoxin/flavin reductase (DIM6/NTAB) family NADH-FMN oxidoreductase RutF
VLEELAIRYPNVKLVCNSKTQTLIKQFFSIDVNAHIVAEGDTLNTGKHTLQFIMAPMVHWPEVMVTYDSTDKILFSADAFGCFGALNGAIFADEVDFDKDYMDEARRYYANIVGKYGTQVLSLLNKAQMLGIDMICPLHGFVWRRNLTDIVSKDQLWSKYQPEEHGVMIAYASVYGNTENAAEILASRLRDKGVKTVMFDVSVTPASEIIAAAFRWSHLVFASTTYNAGIFVSMEALLSDLVAHNIQNRTVAIIENGSWAATSGNLIRQKLEECKNITILEQTVSLKSSLKVSQLEEIDAMVKVLTTPIPPQGGSNSPPVEGGHFAQQNVGVVDPAAMFKLQYGLFILTAKDGAKDNGCVINVASQITASPVRIVIAVNKANYTHDMVFKTKEFNLSVLSEGVPFRIFEQFGFQSGRDTDKFAGGNVERSANGICYVSQHANCVISGRVVESYDSGTHTIFLADVTQTQVLSAEPSVTYQYYFDHIKPKPQPPQEYQKGFVCKICGYMYEGDSLPEDFICPLCKHGSQDFEPL